MTAEGIFLTLGIAVCLFSLWAIGRHDLLRLVRPTRRAMAVVCGHRSSWEDSSYSYAAIYRFRDDAGEHEVIDAVYRAVARPDVGTQVELVYPEGRPDLARPPQLLMWIAVYVLFFALTGLLIGKALGWVEG